MAPNVRLRLSSMFLRPSPSGWCALLLAGSCLNPQPDSFPQSADESPVDAQRSGSGSGNPSAATPVIAPSPGANNTMGVPSSNEGAPALAPAETSPPPSPAPPAVGDQDAGAPEPDAGAPDAAPFTNDAP